MWASSFKKNITSSYCLIYETIIPIFCGSESCVALLYFIAPAVQPAITVFAQQKWQVKCGLDSSGLLCCNLLSIRLLCNSSGFPIGSPLDDCKKNVDWEKLGYIWSKLLVHEVMDGFCTFTSPIEQSRINTQTLYVQFLELWLYYTL